MRDRYDRFPYDTFRTEAEAIAACFVKTCGACGVPIEQEDDAADLAWTAVVNGEIHPSEVSHCDPCAIAEGLRYVTP
jgi:hypothetical protein